MVYKIVDNNSMFSLREISCLFDKLALNELTYYS
jgi:hypothetical protein